MRKRLQGFMFLAALCYGAGAAVHAGTPPSDPPDSRISAGPHADPQLDAELERWHLSLVHAVRRHAHVLAARGDARSLLTAALLWPAGMSQATEGHAVPAARWLQAAARQQPGDPLVAWFQLNRCPVRDAGCAREAIAHLLAVDGDNGAAHLLALNRAWQADDRIAARTHLRLAGAAPRFELYAEGTLELLGDARDSFTPPPVPATLGKRLSQTLGTGRQTTAEDAEAVWLMAVWAAQAMPGFGPLDRICDPEQVDARLRQDCITLLARLADAESSLIAPLVSLSLLARLTAEQPDGGRWRERLRQLYWLRHTALRFLPDQPEAVVTGGEYFGWVSDEGEVAAMRRVLVRNGMATKAPPGWLPSDPRRRALVLSGEPPG